MEEGSGMVAIVRGLRDAGLAVTLLDSGKEYSLVPNSSLNPSSRGNMARGSQKRSTATDVYSDRLDHGLSCDSAAQATDGRYASIYKMAHCKVEPTSPPILLPEFPPQRPEVCHGHDNFVIGGSGSGDNTYAPIQANSPYRVGMSWPERGSLSSPRESRESHAFANSLRKYPNLSPDRSCEIVERLINYTQAKNYSKNLSKFPYSTSPTRLEACPEQVEVERNYSRNTPLIPKPQRNCYESENIKTKSRAREESPTRERPKKFGRNYDIRQLRDISKTVEENLKRVPYYDSYTQALVYPGMRDRCNSPEHRRRYENWSEHNVGTETQASAHMICKDVSTSAQPSKRNVAVPLSSTPSEADHEQEGGVSHPKSSPNNVNVSQCVQTSRLSVPLSLPIKMRKNVQTCVSSCEISRSRNKYTNCRKSKSGDEMRTTTNKKELKDEILEWLDKIFQNYSQNRVFQQDVVEILSCKLGKLSKDRENTIVKVKRRYKTVPVLHRNCDRNCKTCGCSPCDYTECKKEYLRNKRSTKLYFSMLSPEDTFSANNCVKDVIKNWLKDIPIKNHGMDNGKQVKKERLLNDITTIFAEMNLDSATYNHEKLKSDVIKKLSEIKIEIPKGCTKTISLNQLADRLIDKVQNCTGSNSNFDHNKNNINHCPGSSFKIHIQPTENELKNFIKNEMTDFLEKFQINISSNVTEKTENELVDILLDSMESKHSYNDEHVIEEIKASLCDSNTVFEYQGLYLAKILFGHFKTMCNMVNIKELTFELPNQTETVMVLQNTTQITQPEAAEISEDVIAEATLEGDLKLNLDLYMNQLCQQIDNWLTDLHVQVLKSHDTNFRQIVVNDLADDIVDRLRYLEFNSFSHGSDQDELEYLKFQIFKWINKLVGKDIMETISHASELMNRIRTLPVPMLGRPTNSNLPTCCKAEVSPCKVNPNSEPDSFKPCPVAATRAFNKNQMPKFKPADSPTNINNQADTEAGSVNSDGVVNNSQPPNVYSEDTVEAPRVRVPNRRFSQPSGYTTASVNVRPEVTPVSIFQSSILSESLSKFREGQFASSKPTIAGMLEVGHTPESLKTPPSTLRPPGACSLTPCTPSLNELNEEFDLYVKNWVKQIPIQLDTPEEQALMEKIRQGLYNGVWKAIAKIKCQPKILSNPFYYEDVMDDEIEELFSLIPESPEFQREKQVLKAKLLEKITAMNEKIMLSVRPDFKWQLIDSVESYVPRLTTDDRNEDPIKQYEELVVLYFVDDYILFTRYKDEDPVKANVYRKKLLTRIQSLVDEIKKTHGRELNKIDRDMYLNDIISALEQVPLPSDETIREEADEILLGLEIEQWYSDLPIALNDDISEQMKRRRLRDALTIRIHDMEKNMSFSDNTEERALRNEVSRFLKKVPLERDESLNINFMVDELTNRLKNRRKDADAGPSGKRILFDDSITYNEFGNNMPAISSLIVGQSMTNEGISYAFDQPCCRPPQSCCPPELVRQWQSGGQSTNVSNGPPDFTGINQPDSYNDNTQDMIFHTLDETQMPIAMRNYDSAKGMYVPQGQSNQMPSENYAAVQDPTGYEAFSFARPASSSLNYEPGQQMQIERVRPDMSQRQSGRPSSFQQSYPQSPDNTDNTEFFTMEDTRMPSRLRANPANMGQSRIQQYETGRDEGYRVGMQNPSHVSPEQHAAVQDPTGYLNYEPGQQMQIERVRPDLSQRQSGRPSSFQQSYPQNPDNTDNTEFLTMEDTRMPSILRATPAETSGNQNLSGQIKRPCRKCQNSSQPCQKCKPLTPKASNYSAVPSQTSERQDHISAQGLMHPSMDQSRIQQYETGRDEGYRVGIPNTSQVRPEQHAAVQDPTRYEAFSFPRPASSTLNYEPGQQIPIERVRPDLSQRQSGRPSSFQQPYPQSPDNTDNTEFFTMEDTRMPSRLRANPANMGQSRIQPYESGRDEGYRVGMQNPSQVRPEQHAAVQDPTGYEAFSISRPASSTLNYEPGQQMPIERVRPDLSQRQSGRRSSFQQSYPQNPDNTDNTEFLTMEDTRMPSILRATPADIDQSIIQQYEPGQQTSGNQNLSGQIKRPCRECQNSSQPCRKCDQLKPNASNYSAVPLQNSERQDQIPAQGLMHPSMDQSRIQQYETGRDEGYRIGMPNTSQVRPEQHAAVQIPAQGFMHPSMPGGPPTGRQDLSRQGPQIYARPVSPATINQMPAQSPIYTSMPAGQPSGKLNFSAQGPQISFAPVSQIRAQVPIYPSEPTGQTPRRQNVLGQGPQIAMRPQSPANVSQMPGYVSGAQPSLQQQHSQTGQGVVLDPQIVMRPQSPANVSQMPAYVPDAHANLQQQYSQIPGGVPIPRQTVNVIERNISPGRTLSGTSERGIQAQMRPISPAIKSYQSSTPVPTRQVSDAIQQIPEIINSSRHARFDQNLGPSPISAYNQPPVGFSTPQQEIQQGEQPEPVRKSTRGPQKAPGEAFRRHLDFEDSEEETDEDRKMRIQCRCFEKLRRLKRSRPVYYCDDHEMEYAPCPSMAYYNPCFYRRG